MKSFLQFSILSLLIISCGATSGSDEEEPLPLQTAKELIVSMGTGLNIGNTFDLNSRDTSPENNYRIIDLYKSAGMNHIRIPVTWMDGYNGDHLADDNGNVDFEHIRFKSLKAVIDYAIDQEMYVVINAHHEHWLNDNYDGSSPYNDKFSTLWTDIATYFKDYPQYLIFEVLNEPQGNFGEWGGNVSPSNAQGLAFTRQINQVGYDAIRATGENNLTRIIQVAPNGQGNHSQLDNVYPTKASLPGAGEDPYLAMQVHTYDPWDFCGQDGRNSNYPGASSVENSIRSVFAHARSLNVPLNYGEWGVGRNANPLERNTDLVREHYRLIRNTVLDEGGAPTAWEDGGWFGLIDAVGDNYTFRFDIVPYMMAEDE